MSGFSTDLDSTFQGSTFSSPAAGPESQGQEELQEFIQLEQQKAQVRAQVFNKIELITIYFIKKPQKFNKL